MTFETILYNVSDNIATITLNRPDKRNALDLIMRVEIADAFDEAGRDDDVRAVILTGSGGSFCAGGDISGMQSMKTAAGTRTRLRAVMEAITNMVNFEKPIIALVDGPAYGAGFNIALACDFILGTERARFCQVFGRIGLIPDYGGHYLLPRVVGMQKAKELIFSAREVRADEALSLGILYEVCETAEDLAQRGRELAASFVDASPNALSVSKSILNESLNASLQGVLEMEAAGQGICSVSDYHKDAVSRFLNKEPLRYAWPARKA